MANVFRYTDLFYSQVPDYFVDNILLKINRLVTVKLYLFILRRAQQNSKVTVKINSKEVLLALGITPKGLTNARTELREHKLVSSIETDNQGLWAYTLIHPVTCDPLPDPRATVDFNALDEEQIKGYFLQRLKAYKPLERPLSVSTVDGGVWHCFRCSKAGKLVEFEVAMAARSKEVLTRKEAHHRVRIHLSKLAPVKNDLQTVADDEPIPTL